jgi:hypothetical protein
MRGGAIPILAWAVLLTVLFIGNWIWDSHGVNPIVAAAGALITFATAAWVLIRSGRAAVRPGPPEPRTEVETVPELSSGAVLAALAFACMMFGFTFGNFLVYFGAAVLVASLGRIAVEVRSERETRRRVMEGRR